MAADEVLASLTGLTEAALVTKLAENRVVQANGAKTRQLPLEQSSMRAAKGDSPAFSRVDLSRRRTFE